MNLTLTRRMELKELNDKGRFIGHASVYGNTDDGGDVVVAGALRKTVQDNEGKFPLMYNHRETIGVSNVEDSPKSLITEGFINLNLVEGQKVYTNMEFFKSRGHSFGMSIGYAAIGDKIQRKNGVRYLHEIVLYETTVTESPMNRAARVTDVKSLLELLQEVKIGRRFSSATRAKIEGLVNEFQSLLAEAESTESDDGADMIEEPQKMHSALVSLKQSIPASLFN